MTFYAAAVQTMSHSWRAFLFGGFDPGGYLTVDKLPGDFWVQALAARIFGFSTFTVVLPQAIEGVLTIGIVYRSLRRITSRRAALLAAAIMLVTPVSTALGHGNVPDSLSNLLLVLAADATLRSIIGGKFRSLALAGIWVGLAFQAKMIQAWLILPVLAVVYVRAAPQQLGARLLRATASVVIAVAVSLSWMLILLATPSSAHPWFDGSLKDSIFEQVFVYNGLGRFDADSAYGLRSTTRSAAGTAVPHFFLGRMFYSQIALGAGWLLATAILIGVALLWFRRGARRTDPLNGTVLLWLLWVVGYAFTFSVLSHINDYYTAVLVPGVSVLVAVGAEAVWSRRLTHRQAWLVPVLVTVTLGYQLLLLHKAGRHWSGLLDIAAVVAAVSITASFGCPFASALPHVGLSAASLLTVTGLLLVPAAGSVAMDTHESGAYTYAFSEIGIGTLKPLHYLPLQERYLAHESRLVSYLTNHDSGQRFLVATYGSRPAADLILATHRAVLPIGGYTRLIPTPTLAQLQTFVAQGWLRFVFTNRSADPRIQWVTSRCRLVGPFTSADAVDYSLYDCRDADR